LASTDSARSIRRERLSGLFPICFNDFASALPEVLSVSSNLHRTTIEVGAPLNGKRSVVNIADNMGLRLQNDVTPLNRTLDFSIHNHALGYNDTVDLSPSGDHQGCAVKLAINVTMEPQLSPQR
jgi:hypothetical protein